MTVYLVLYTVDALKKHKTTMYIHIYIYILIGGFNHPKKY